MGIEAITFYTVDGSPSKLATNFSATPLAYTTQSQTAMSGAGAASRGLLGAIAGPSRPLASSPASRASQLVARRCCFSTSSAACNSPPKPFRCYRYAIDVHGQLFLYDTKPKNLTSCFKNKEFLNFFIPRIKPLNTRDMQVVSEEYFTELLDDENWTDRNDLEGEIAAHVAAAQGYHYLSSCGPEYNFIRTADTPIVYRELTEDGEREAHSTS